MPQQRFVFKFSHAAAYRTESIVLIGTHGEDARSGAWAVLGERVHDREARATWRLVSMRQEPVLPARIRAVA